jgi:hypothetical protein
MNTLRVVLLGAMLIASLGACSSAGKCRRGELGCACQTGNICEPDARCVAQRCENSAAAAGGSGGAGRGGTGGSTAGSDASDVCSSTSFDAACRSYCAAFCDSQGPLCEHSSCQPGFCEAESYASEVRPVCEETCGNDASCVTQMCLDQRNTTCETFRGFKPDGGVVPGCLNNDPKCELSPP